MSNVVRIRTELKKKYNDPDKNFKEMLQAFRREVSKSGIMHDFKDHQFYESRSEKDRHIKRASQKKALMESIEKKILTGEKVNAPAGIIKKVKSNMLKDKKDKDDKKKGQYRNQRQYED